MDDELTHYGVLGMKWGHRKQATGSQIRAARRRVGNARDQIKKQELRARTAKGAAAVKRESKTLDKMTADYLKNPDRVISARMTRGEKITSVILTGPYGVAAIAGTSARSRRIEQLQDQRG